MSTEKRNCFDESLLEPRDDCSASELEFAHPCPLCDGPKPVAEMSEGEVEHVLLHQEADGLCWRTGGVRRDSNGKLWPVFETDLSRTDAELRRQPKRRQLN